MLHATAHAQVRAAQRLPFVADEGDFRAVVDDIIAAVLHERLDAMRLRAQRDGSEVWAARMRGHWVYVIYSPAFARIVTVMRPAMALCT